MLIAEELAKRDDFYPNGVPGKGVRGEDKFSGKEFRCKNFK